ncbi:hypothetical protein AALP_AA3G282500 [Arabis alpina]|nr:hypothetical protein AALP_AA3G282500 [Arabis alpina]
MLTGYNFLSDGFHNFDQKYRELSVANKELTEEVELDGHKLQVGQTKADLDKTEEGRKSDAARVDNQLTEMKSAVDIEVAPAVSKSEMKLNAEYDDRLKLMELRSKALVEKARLSSLASQVYRVLERMRKAEERGEVVDAAKRKKFEGDLATYRSATDALVIPSFPGAEQLVDEQGGDASENESSDTEGIDSSSEEEDGRKTYGDKVPSDAHIKIVVAAAVEDQVEEAGIDLTTRDTLAPLFDYPEPSLQHQKKVP